MSPSQIALLKRLIDADREYHRNMLDGVIVSINDRGVLISTMDAAVDAEVLVSMGLVEMVNVGANITDPHLAFLGAYDPYDIIDREPQST